MTDSYMRRVGTALVALLIVACHPQGAPAGPGATTRAFERTLRLAGITFDVSCPNDRSIPTLRIVPAELEVDNPAVIREVDGIVVGAEVADLNADASPEIYVYVQSAGSGSYGSLVAYSANNRKSLSAIHLPSVAENEKAVKGYRGHDAFAVAGSTLVRRFPVYRQEDTNATPTGGARQLQYKLVAGEAGWMLKLDEIVDE